jgi:hypothetical protein
MLRTRTSTAVGEQHGRAVEALDGGDDLDLSGLKEGHEPFCVGRRLLAAAHCCGEPDW